MRKLLAALVALFAFTLLAGCGASGGDEAAPEGESTTSTEAGADDPVDDTTTTEPESSTTTEAPGDGARDIDAWASDFCGSFQTWLGAIEASGAAVETSVTPGDLESSKAAIVGLFDSVGTHTDTLLADLEAQGHPDVTDGEALVQRLLDRFGAFSTAIATAHVDAQNTDTSSPEVFQEQMLGLIETFQQEVTEVGESFAELDTRFPDPDLQAALLSCEF